MQHLTNLISDIHIFTIYIVFLSAFLIQLIYYLVIFSRVAFYKHKPAEADHHPVSVIICARNEAENLKNHLPAVLEQDYGQFEVIVVNDCSTDDTEEVVGPLMAANPRLKMTTIKPDRKFTHGKKLAVTIGIKAAQYEHLLFIDADCKPAGRQWLQSMVSRFDDNIQIVLGYGGYFAKSGLLNSYIRYDTLFIALQYLSFALCRIPYMGVGRNLAYRKSLFYSGNGFSKHLHLASGDDDLFVNEHATRGNTAVQFSLDSHTRSDPEQTFEKWVFQKKRHFSTAKLYRQKHKFLLGLEPACRLLFYASFIYLLFVPGLWPYLVSVFFVRMVVQLLVIKKTMIHLNEKNILVNSLFFDVISMIINLILYISNRFRPRDYQWK